MSKFEDMAEDDAQRFVEERHAYIGRLYADKAKLSQMASDYLLVYDAGEILLLMRIAASCIEGSWPSGEDRHAVHMLIEEVADKAIEDKDDDAPSMPKSAAEIEDDAICAIEDARIAAMCVYRPRNCLYSVKEPFCGQA